MTVKWILICLDSNWGGFCHEKWYFAGLWKSSYVLNRSILSIYSFNSSFLPAAANARIGTAWRRLLDTVHVSKIDVIDRPDRLQAAPRPCDEILRQGS